MKDLIGRLREEAIHIDEKDGSTKDAVDAMNEAADALEAQQWVSAEDRLPKADPEKEYLIDIGGVCFEVAERLSDGWRDTSGERYYDDIPPAVTHWRSISPPESN